jgi:putative hemolysin
MANTLLEISLILILVVLNGIFAMSEIAIISSRKFKLQKMVNEGSESAKTALELADSPNRFLSTIQVGITLIGILAGAYGGATIAEQIGAFFSSIGPLAPYSEAIGVVIVVLIITYLSLIIGELVPKRLGLNNPEKKAVKIAKPMKALSKVAMPIIYILSASTDFVLRVLRVKEAKEETITEDEIQLLIEEGTHAGTFEKAEQDMIKRVFSLDDLRVNALMKPRKDIIWLDIDDSEEELQKKIIESERAIFPVGKEDLDDFLGVVQVKELINPALRGEPIEIKKYLRKPLLVPESLYALELLKLFKKSGEHVHMAMVLDEYGGIEGLITLNDVLEAIVGDIPAIDEPDEPKAVKRKDDTWLIDGFLPVEKFKYLFNIGELPEEENNDYNTMGGFVMVYLGKIPEVAETFEWNRFKFEIVDMDGHHIDKILVTPPNKEDNPN